MDWHRHYDALMHRAVGRVLSGYTERHHVIPRCMGGDDTKANIVMLTAKEHFVAHKLLVRMYPKVRGLWLALVAMGRLSEYKSRIFTSERAKAAEIRKGFKYTEASRLKMSESAKARGPNGEATAFKAGREPWNKGKTAWRSGYSHSSETRAKMKATQQANREAHAERMRQWWADRKTAING
nr:MAG TPA_asm: HNH endonuclease [Bacteriophage sp.]